MKKFVFTLQKPYELKIISRDQLLSQRDSLKKQLAALREKREATLRAMREQGERMSAECSAGIRASQISYYGGFIAGALSDIKIQDGLISKLLIQMEDNTGKLMRIINEIKVMEKIRDEQMEEYNKELQKNDDKMLEDFLCGRI